MNGAIPSAIETAKIGAASIGTRVGMSVIDDLIVSHV